MPSIKAELKSPKWSSWSAHVAWGINLTILSSYFFTMPEAVALSFAAGLIWEGLVGIPFGWGPKVLDLATWLAGSFIGWGLVYLLTIKG